MPKRVKKPVRAKGARKALGGVSQLAELQRDRKSVV